MIPILDILAIITKFEYVGEKSHIISKPVSLNSNDFNSHTITWASEKNQHLIEKVFSGVIVCHHSNKVFNTHCGYILVEDPRLVFTKIIEVFFQIKDDPKVSKLACIDDSVTIKENCNVEPFAVIEKNCRLGIGVLIGSGTVIKEGTIIGNHVKIGANCTIGGVGFGYVKNDSGNYINIPHIGNVVIHDNVEIGNNTCIDKAVMGSTIIGKNTKVDNLVHIAHGVKIGENSLIIANAMVAGSTNIGDNVWVAPSASILNKLSISNNSIIGMGSVIVKNVGESQVVVGNPGRAIKKNEQ
jgi:UDP-3-O-[3-hydroxymyristoyl] glucosamine N-acyltransferase